ncbi:hypothetical protein CIB84_015699 [Bambusicola thoracicus]|uniref:Uncharacterized protein n=1 Tax=Bambusicola thoracicus TaxID=9083 RepID=A0A2P4S8V1_BAMTH|nr:hypothetical protein CIB84_015699 [Bambusicola thoracicus]
MQWWSGSSTGASYSPGRDSGWSWTAGETMTPGKYPGSAWTRVGTFISFSPVTIRTPPHLMGVREHLHTLRHHGESAPPGWW